MSSIPTFLYKYRAISSKEPPRDDYSLDALFNSYLPFSGRRAFNDLFDSKIDFVHPTAKQLKAIGCLLRKKEKKTFQTYYANGHITDEGNEYIEKWIKELNGLLDGYAFCCVSANSKSNLMWSHYADSHHGFCIEFRTEKLNAAKVSYADSIPKIHIAEIIKATELEQEQEFKIIGENLWDALRVKLNEWEYEEEYRCQLDDKYSELKIRNGDPCVKISYGPDFVESIIFGCRMPEEHRRLIIEKMPYRVPFKQAVAKTSSIEIVEYTIK
jgi:hypothetical protein